MKDQNIIYVDKLNILVMDYECVSLRKTRYF